MAKGPKPKAPSKRARRNRASTAAEIERRKPASAAESAVPGTCLDCGTFLPGNEDRCEECAAARVRAPSLPKLTFEDGSPKPWHALTVKWWKDVWHSEMAPEYVESDIHGLFRLAMLMDAFYRAPSVSLSAEIRLLASEYGLAPLSRRRLDWTKAGSKAKAKRPRGAPQEVTDPRLLMRAVK